MINPCTSYYARCNAAVVANDISAASSTTRSTVIWYSSTVVGRATAWVAYKSLQLRLVSSTTTLASCRQVSWF